MARYYDDRYDRRRRYEDDRYDRYDRRRRYEDDDRYDRGRRYEDDRYDRYDRGRRYEDRRRDEPDGPGYGFIEPCKVGGVVRRAVHLSRGVFADLDIRPGDGRTLRLGVFIPEALAAEAPEAVAEGRPLVVVGRFDKARDGRWILRAEKFAAETDAPAPEPTPAAPDQDLSWLTG